MNPYLDGYMAKQAGPGLFSYMIAPDLATPAIGAATGDMAAQERAGVDEAKARSKVMLGRGALGTVLGAILGYSLGGNNRWNAAATGAVALGGAGVLSSRIV